MSIARLIAPAVLAGLAGCTVAPPPPAPLVALPGPGKTQVAFGQDDVACRTAAAQPAAAPATPVAPAASPTAGAAALPPLSPGEWYLRCMASRNNVIQPLAAASPAYYGYYSAYPVYAGFGDYYPFLYGVGFFGDGFYGRGFYGGGFYGHGFYGHGFYGGGFHGGYGGFHGGGGEGGFHGGGGGGHR